MRSMRTLRRHPVVATAIDTVARSGDIGPQDLAASIAFYGFFSLFPLLILITAGTSVFFEPSEVAPRIADVLARELPGSEEVVRESLDAMIQLRGAASAVGVVSLLWSASKMFGAVRRALERTLRVPEERGFYSGTVVQLLATLTVATATVVILALAVALDVFGRIDLAALGVPELVPAAVWSRVASAVFATAAFAVAYRYIPSLAPTWREVVPGALLAGAGFEVGKQAFAIYLDHADTLSAVYGALTSATVLMLWLYVSARIVLLGAALIAARRDAQTSA